MPEKSEMLFLMLKILNQHFNIFLEFHLNFFDFFPNF